MQVEWLREATAQLDPRDPLVSAHVPLILRDLQVSPITPPASPLSLPFPPSTSARPPREPPPPHPT